jgi:hypothetical protein
VFRTLGRRAAESVVVLFALLGFAYVPLGSRTALEHMVLVAQTAPAREAANGLVSAIGRGRDLLVRALVSRDPNTEALPLPSAGNAVRPVPPPLRESRPRQQRER